MLLKLHVFEIQSLETVPNACKLSQATNVLFQLAWLESAQNIVRNYRQEQISITWSILALLGRQRSKTVKNSHETEFIVKLNENRYARYKMDKHVIKSTQWTDETKGDKILRSFVNIPHSKRSPDEMSITVKA